MAFPKRALALLAALALVPACREAQGNDAHLTPAVLSSDTRTSFSPDRLPKLVLPEGRQLAVRSVLNVPGRMTYGDHIWDENGVPPGPLSIIVDLSAQTVSVFRGGHEVGTAVTLYGAEEKPTPTGRFAVIAKRKDHWSATYDAPMPYMLRLTDDGVAIHGSSVLPGAATHGCIGVPLEFARQLFDRAQLGDEVVILNAPAATTT